MTEVMECTAIQSVFDRDDRLFDSFARSCEHQFATVAPGNTPIFTVETKRDLYDIYLDAFPASERQHHTCHCCRQFIQRYGNLAVVDDAGMITPAIWNSQTVPEQFRPVAEALEFAVRSGVVDGVFVASEKVWGTPVTGQWHHFAVRPDAARLHRDRLLTPYQVMAQKKQDFGTLSHGIADFKHDLLIQALNLLESNTLHRSEKFTGPLKFLLDLHGALDKTTNRRYRTNLIWKAVAVAPVGFATPRSSMIGTLLDDLKEGMSLEAVKRRFAEKTHPLQYQRPQAPARAGNILEAERIVEKLGIANSLKRRFATLDEVKKIWTPAAARQADKPGGVFGHLMQPAPAARELVGMVQNMTWVKFVATVLPRAEQMAVQIGNPDNRLNFVGVTAAIDPEAPPIFQWDDEADRNAFAWYVYHNGSTPARWNLPGQWADVTGVMLKPCLWNDKDERFAKIHGNNAILILDGAVDTKMQGLALFPGCLRSELHQIRSTIEAYSNAGTPEGALEGSANGIMVGGDKSMSPVIRVTTATGKADYRIDRWD